VNQANEGVVGHRTFGVCLDFLQKLHDSNSRIASRRSMGDSQILSHFAAAVVPVVQSHDFIIVIRY
jgi:hypothetical protein